MSDDRDVLDHLRGFEGAYPKDIFVPLTIEQRKQLHQDEPGLQDCIAADMARHLIRVAIIPAVDEIERLREERERDREQRLLLGAEIELQKERIEGLGEELADRKEDITNLAQASSASAINTMLQASAFRNQARRMRKRMVEDDK